MTDTIKYAKLTALQTTEVVLALRQHFDTVKGAYHDGWNDRRVADHVKCNPAGVERIRAQNFGRLRTGYVGNKDLSDKLTECQALIEELTNDYSKLRNDVVKLMSIVRYHVTEQSLKTALAEMEKRYPLANLKDSTADISNMRGDKQ